MKFYTPPYQCLIIVMLLSISSFSFAQNETCTPDEEFVQGRDWCATAFGINRADGNSGSPVVRNCCDSFVIEFEIRLNYEDWDAPNPAYGGLFSDYLDLSDPDLIFENCQVVYNASAGRDEVIVDMTFPSINELQSFYAYARVIDPTPSGFPGNDHKLYNFFCKNNSGTRNYITAIDVSGVDPETCLETSLVSDLYNEGVFGGYYQLGFGLESYETLIVDEDLQLGRDISTDESTIVVVGAGSQIVVKSGNKLEIYYRDFRNCTGKFWKGIYVEKGAELVIKDSEIPYAEHAVEFEKGAILTLENNVFVDNYVSIKGIPEEIPLGGGSSPSTEILSFKGNLFTGTGTLADTYEGQTTNPQDYPFAGIVLGNASQPGFTCGTTRFTNSDNTKLNEFNYMANGIINKRYGANLYVEGASFYNINSNYGQGYNTVGFGINHDAMIRPCIVNGFSSWPDEYSFKNVDVCLQTNLASIVKFDKQEVINSGRGVYSTKTLLASYINNNSFSTKKTAIEVANTNLVRGDFEIIGNDVDLDISVPDITDNRGIKLTNVTVPTSNPFSTRSIEGNNINAEYAVAGIELDMVKNLEVVDNFVQIPPDVNGYIGISTIGAEMLTMTCNDIQGYYNLSGNDEYVKGISFSGMNKCFITCNDIQRTKIGIHFEKMSTRAHLKGNVFNEHSVGVQYGTTQYPNGQSGPQYYNGNKWISGYNPVNNEFGAKHYALLSIARKSAYTVNDNQISDYTTVDDPDFVKEEYDKNNFSCESLQLSCIELGLVDKQWDKLDSVSLKDTIFEEQYLRDLQWKVYKNMKDSIIDYNYSLDTIAQNIGLDELYSADSELKGIKALLHYNFSTDSLFSSEGVDTLSSAFMDSILYNELSSGLDSMKVAVTSYVVNEDYNINSEDYYIGNMSDALYYEAKLLKQDAGALDSFSIGVCSFFGGEAWDRMNSILPSHLISHTLNTTCAGVYPRESFGKESKKYEFTISPNPVQNELTVYNIKGGEKVEYRIFDMNGRIVQKGYISTEANDVLLGDSFGAGVFILTLEGNYRSIKFVVIR